MKTTEYLLTLAIGTEKTYIAFQIVYRLFQSKWNKDGSNRRPKILFLADSNILKDQAYSTFNPKVVIYNVKLNPIAKVFFTIHPIK